MMHSDDRKDLVEDGPRFKRENTKQMILLCVLLWVVTIIAFIGVGEFYSFNLG